MFKTEKELIKTITDNQNNLISLTNWNNYENTKILAELNLGYGIPDLVVARYSHINIGRFEPLLYADILIFKILEKKPGLTFCEIIDATRTSERKLRNSINRLNQEGFLEIKDDKYYAKKVNPIATETLAIEAKLKNWKRALKQAYRYKWFSSYSYVIMDAKYIGPAKENKSLFRKFNVGLASVIEDGSISVLYRPQRIKPIDEAMQFLLTEHLYFRS